MFPILILILVLVLIFWLECLFDRVTGGKPKVNPGISLNGGKKV